MLLLACLAALASALPQSIPAGNTITAQQVSATLADGSTVVLGNLLPLKGAPINSTCVPITQSTWATITVGPVSVSGAPSLPGCPHIRSKLVQFAKVYICKDKY
jgi:hypothetical protein